MSLGDPGAADERVVSLEDIRRSEAIIAALAARRAVLPGDPAVDLLAALSWDVDGRVGAGTCPSTSKRGVKPGRVFAASVAAAAVVVALAVVAHPDQPARGGNVTLAGSPASTGQRVAVAPAGRSHDPHAGAAQGRWQPQRSQPAAGGEQPRGVRPGLGTGQRVPGGGRSTGIAGQRAASGRDGVAGHEAPVRAEHPARAAVAPVAGAGAAPSVRQPAASSIRAASARGATPGTRAHHGTKRPHRLIRPVAARPWQFWLSGPRTTRGNEVAPAQPGHL